MRSGYYIGDIAPAVPATVTTPIPIPAGYVLVPSPPPAPITAATGGLNLDWRGEPIQNPAHLVPVVELHPNGKASAPVMVPIHELDSMVGELAEDFDFGLGAYRIANPERELGQFRLNIKAPNIKLPKVAVSIAKGAYSVLAPASKPTKKAPVRAAVRKVQKAKKAPVVIARKKPEQNNISSPQTLAQIFGELKRQGKIVNLLATKKQVTAEHKRRSSDDDFRDTVTTLLRKIEKQCAGDISGNYFARWNKLKKATGVGI